MPSSLVASRVDDSVREKAEFYIRRAGMTPSDVIRIVWQNIAESGEVPRAHTDESSARISPLIERMRALRETTPRSDFLETLTPQDLKRELEARG